MKIAKSSLAILDDFQIWWLKEKPVNKYIIYKNTLFHQAKMKWKPSSCRMMELPSYFCAAEEP